MKASILSTTFTAAFVLTLSGCGGGSDSNSTDSKPRYTIGGTVTGLDSTGLVLQNNGADDLSVAGTSFEFATALSDGSSYQVSILTQPSGQYCDISAGSGSLSGSNVSDIQVTCRSWGTAELIEQGTRNAFDPQIAVDSNGNALAVWEQWDGSRYNIRSNRYTAGSGWGTDGLVEGDNTGSAKAVQVALDANGNALAVWEQWDGSRYNIRSNRYTAGSGWGASAERVDSANTGNATGPQIAVNAGGIVVVVWSQFDGTRDNIWANRYDGTSWSGAELIETDDTGAATHVQVAVDALGNALAVWRQDDGTRYNIWANRYVAGSGWGSAELIETDDNGDAYFPQITMGDDGNALVVWHHSDGTRNNIMANRYTAGTGWGTAEPVESTTDWAEDPQVAVDADGNALVVWEQSDGTRDNIWANYYSADSGWSGAQAIESDDAGGAYLPQVAFDARGNALVVWEQSNGTRNNIWSNRYTAGSGWGRAQLIEIDDAGDASRPQVAVDGDGNALAVWYQSDASNVRSIWANRFE